MDPMFAHGSRAGEDNSWHVAGAVVAIGLLVLVTGLVNIKIGRSGS